MVWQWYGSYMNPKQDPPKDFLQVTVSLRPADVAKLDEWAQAAHVPRSAMIRMLIQDRAAKK